MPCDSTDLAMPIDGLHALLAGVPAVPWHRALPVLPVLILFCVQRRRKRMQVSRGFLLNRTGEQREKRQARLYSVTNSFSEMEDELEWQIERAELCSRHPRF